VYSHQKFGGDWTKKKLDAIEKYLGFFTTVLKKQKFKLCYIDAFSGSGNVTLKDGNVTDGSAIRALKFPFDKYYFIEKDKEHFEALYQKIHMDYRDKSNIISVINGDCNDLMQSINSQQWYSNWWRGVIFLDPYAMQLDWASLESISMTHAFDVWYLFPYSAVNRNLNKDGEIPDANVKKLNKIFGTEVWKDEIYKKPDQMSLFEIYEGEQSMEKIPEGLKTFIIKRLDETFSKVAPNPIILKNTKNSPLFLLCFAISNPGKTAQERAMTGAKHILDHMED